MTIHCSARIHLRSNGSESFELLREVTLLGRDRGCDIVLSPRSVSRRHAQIIRLPSLGYELRDLGSTGGTFLNGKLVTRPTLIRGGDRIRLGECLLIVEEKDETMRDHPACGATILEERDASSAAEQEQVAVRAEQKLRAILEIGRNLSGTLDLEGVLKKALDGLFHIFSQAERGFLLLREDQDGDLTLRAFKRRGNDQGDFSFSRVIFEHVTGRDMAVLCANVIDDARLSGDSFDDAQVRTMMCVPLRNHNRLPIGILQLDTRDEQVMFDEADLDLLVSVAGQVGSAIDNARLLDEARHARLEAEAASRAKDRFLAILSHELRTPLTPVLVATSALLERDQQATIRPELEMIRRNIELEARLIDDLLDLTHATRGEFRLDRRSIEIHKVIGEALEICQGAIDEAGLTLVTEFKALEPWLVADPVRLRQVMWNLVQNALKFTPSGGTLTVSTRNQAPNRLLIEVRDTGIGIDSSLMPKIFEAFEQGQIAPQQRASGLGLGLAISRSLVEAHGGQLSVESPGPGRGSSFLLELPCNTENPVSTAEYSPVLGMDSVKSSGPSPSTSLPLLKILLVEDNRDTLHYLALVLRSRGHFVTEAANLAAAQASVSGGSSSDLLISDIELPDGSGLDLMQELAASGQVTVGLAMSGFGSEDDIHQSLLAGFAEHLTKPLDLPRLEAVLQRILPLLFPNDSSTTQSDGSTDNPPRD